MKVFLDFDDVLFNTKSFLEGFRGAFVGCGVDPEIFQLRYAEARENPGGIPGYNYERHIRLLVEKDGAHKECLRKNTDIFLGNLGRYVFHDVPGFLDSLRGNHMSISLLSFGSEDFQRKKVSGSGLSLFFSDIIVGDIDKAEALKQIWQNSGEKEWFLDDRSEHIDRVKQVLPSIGTILVTRAEGRYTDAKTAWCDFQVKNLEEAEEIIKDSI